MSGLSSIKSINEFKDLAEIAITEWRQEKHKSPPPENLKVVKIVKDLIDTWPITFIVSSRYPNMVHKLIKYTIQSEWARKNKDYTIYLLHILHLTKLEQLKQTYGKKMEETMIQMKEPPEKKKKQEFTSPQEQTPSSSEAKKTCVSEQSDCFGFSELFGKKQKHGVSFIDPEGRQVVVDKLAFQLLFPEYIKSSQRFSKSKSAEIKPPFFSAFSLEDVKQLTDMGFFDDFSNEKILEALALCDMLAPGDSENFLLDCCINYLRCAFENFQESSEETLKLGPLDPDSRWIIQTYRYLGVEAADEVNKKLWQAEITGEPGVWQHEIEQFYAQHHQESLERDSLLGRALVSALHFPEIHKGFSTLLTRQERVSVSTLKRLLQENSFAGISFRAISQKAPLCLVLNTEKDLLELKELLLKDPSLTRYIESIIDMSGSLTPHDFFDDRRVSEIGGHFSGERRPCFGCLCRHRVHVEGNEIKFIGNVEDVQLYMKDCRGSDRYRFSEALDRYEAPDNRKTWAQLKAEALEAEQVRE